MLGCLQAHFGSNLIKARAVIYFFVISSVPFQQGNTEKCLLPASKCLGEKCIYYAGMQHLDTLDYFLF